MHKSVVYLFLLFYSFVSLSQTEQFQFEHLSTADGLSQSSAIAIHQDDLGQIWIGTRDGLNKYDGTKFTVYRSQVDNSNSISNNDILAIEQDSQGFIWIGTYNGLNKYNPKTSTFKRYFHNENKNSLANNTIWTIRELSNGEIWIGTSNGLSVYNIETDDFKTSLNSEDENSLVGNHVLSIFETNDKQVFIGTTTGLSHYLGQEEEAFQFRTVNGTEPLYIQDIVESNGNKILLATRDQSVVVYDRSANSLLPYFSEKQSKNFDKNARQLLFDGENRLWIGTYNGLQIVNDKGEISIAKNDLSNSKSLTKNSVKSLYKDQKGSIWIGTYYGGIDIWDKSNENFANITQTPNGTGLSYNVVSSIENYKDDVFIGTEGGGITVFNSAKNTFEYINTANTDKLPDNNIKSLHLSDDNKLWIGTFSKGVALYDVVEKRFETSEIAPELRSYLSNVGIYSIKQDRGSNIWFGTFGKGLIKYDMISRENQVFNDNLNGKNKLSSNLVRAVIIDRTNKVWAATERGLNKIEASGTITNYFYDAQLESGDDILSIFEDSNGTIWVGTKAKGLYVLENSEFKSVPISVNENELSSIHSILQDDANALWISTNQGLINYNLETKTAKVYNQEQGVIGNEFNDNASLKVGKSQFFFGGPSGVTYFNSEKLKINAFSPQVIITDFKIKNESVNVANDGALVDKAIQFLEALDLSYDQGNFSIDFAIPNFINANNNKYKYRLKGLEDDWIYTSENSASYTIQNSGDYIFEVIGANSDGVWNEEATQLRINVAPAPWKSWWAFTLYGLAILAALYFLTSILKSRTRLKTELELEHLEVERTKKINKAKLEFFTNISHEFRTPLTLILGPLQQILADYKGNSKTYKKLLTVESSANHLLHLINRLMDFRKLENNLIKLEAAEGNIVKFLKEIYLSFSEHAKNGDYDYSFHTTDDKILVYYDRYKLERVFFNLVSNAFRYTPKGGKIAFRIIKKENHISIQIEDSGVGIASENKEKIFDRFFEVQVNNKPENNYNKGTGIGLSIAKNMVNLHKGDIYVKDNTPEGSVFLVELQLGKNHLSEGEIIKDFKFSDDVSQYVTKQSFEDTNHLKEEKVKAAKAEDKPTLLLVEDNQALRQFMHNILKDDYNIIEAENGKLALKLAHKELPNLIVSDVVMPVMAGTELCVAIKEDIKTSHIPVILLTSRSALIYRVEGLESGADDYISKPFDVNEFKLRIKNILEATERLKQKFTSEDPLQPNEVILSSLDEKLYKKALQIVEDNIGNEQFDIPYFCSELGVSRTMLFVKVKAWTNFTPNEFIQHFRMKRAAQLLEQGKINISEVSYKVGFKNPKYFSKCFQKKFGETPSKYANKFSDY